MKTLQTGKGKRTREKQKEKRTVHALQRGRQRVDDDFVRKDINIIREKLIRGEGKLIVPQSKNHGIYTVKTSNGRVFPVYNYKSKIVITLLTELMVIQNLISSRMVLRLMGMEHRAVKRQCSLSPILNMWKYNFSGITFYFSHNSKNGKLEAKYVNEKRMS